MFISARRSTGGPQFSALQKEVETAVPRDGVDRVTISRQLLHRLISVALRQKAEFDDGYYLATHPDKEGLAAVISRLCTEKNIHSPLANGAAPPEGVEVTERVSPAGKTLLYLLNHTEKPISVALASGNFTDLLTGNVLSGTTQIEPLGVQILV